MGGKRTSNLAVQEGGSQHCDRCDMERKKIKREYVTWCTAMVDDVDEYLKSVALSSC